MTQNLYYAGDVVCIIRRNFLDKQIIIMLS